MCGICGILDFSDNIHIDEELLLKMTQTLHHRGPDDLGTYTERPVGLGHTRLSILDLSQAGHQPMLSKNRQVVLAYNGEIYNFPELRAELQNLGHQFISNSDTEVVLTAYEQWGTDSFARFEGMFAFAIWDKTKGELHLARDVFGIKPFYYAALPKGIIFGSEVKAILASGQLSAEMEMQSLSEYLYYGTALGENSMFAGVRKLLPGHRIQLTEKGMSIHQFASKYDLEPSTDDWLTAKQKTTQLLDDAVARHLISDVPVGLFLSGGIDSSAIAALASRHYQKKLKTYSVGFDFDKGVNELDKARFVAERFGTEHHEIHVSGKNISETIEALVRSHDEPFGDAADLPLYLLCREIKDQVKVVLQGDGGDEIFAGYRRYNVLSAERTWRTLAAVGSPLFKILPKKPAIDRMRRFLSTMGHQTSAMRMAMLMTVETLEEPPSRLLSSQALNNLKNTNPFLRYEQMAELFAKEDPIQRMLFSDCSIILPDIFLEKVDKSTMAHSVEVRVPFLDRRLTRYVMSLPSHYKVKRGKKKYLLREAMRGIVPDEILDGPKTGFGVPYGYWLKEPLAEYLKSVLLDQSIKEWGLFDMKRLETSIHEHISGQRNHGFLLYKLLNLGLWHRFYLTGQQPTPVRTAQGALN